MLIDDPTLFRNSYGVTKEDFVAAEARKHQEAGYSHEMAVILAQARADALEKMYLSEHHSWGVLALWDTFRRLYEPDPEKVGAQLDYRVARLALDINHRLIPRRLSDFDHQVPVADYLSKQKLRIELPRRYLLKAGVSEVDGRAIRKLLAKWGFAHRRITPVVKRGKYFRSGTPYIDITFKVD